ncbi:hypothetical protein COO91_08637 [Nostoc flagelliforme CCNUN1]|uniref:Uncharacterized protein n=1 Tax=Nostoc flagelliforme CCNUN1 TaxID=2038116 RepID=A0A2K8T4A8_9NOSO|nr:hypothetical protein COO91_08637 [Nostoc flagelliforme CCNUN1]
MQTDPWLSKGFPENKMPSRRFRPSGRKHLSPWVEPKYI